MTMVTVPGFQKIKECPRDDTNIRSNLLHAPGYALKAWYDEHSHLFAWSQTSSISDLEL